MERLAERLLPYWSIAINLILALTLLAASSSTGVIYSRRYAGRIFTALELTVLR